MWIDRMSTSSHRHAAETIDILITDETAPSAVLDQFRDMGVDVRVAAGTEERSSHTRRHPAETRLMITALRGRNRANLLRLLHLNAPTTRAKMAAGVAGAGVGLLLDQELSRAACQMARSTMGGRPVIRGILRGLDA
jgi:hypothetical protein